MSSSCLYGPSFSLNAETYYSSNNVEFSLVFEEPESESLVLGYEWYLDDCLVTDKNDLIFQSSLSCGNHKIGVRILTEQGWSGLVAHEFSTCRVPVAIVISGPDTVQEGDTATYKIFRTFSDGYSEDVTADYEFQSTTGGSFAGNVFTANRDDADYQDRQVTITALENGEVKATKTITVVNTTTITLAFIKITGPVSVNEGASASYSVIATYSNGSEADVSTQYSFAASEGSFAGNVFTANRDDADYQDRQVTITALENGEVKATRTITVVNTTTITLAFIKITGPVNVNEGASASYSVIATYSNGSEADVSTQYTFAASEGSFSGQVYTAAANSIPGDSRQVKIDALQQGIIKATRQINVVDNSLSAGILVVDFYNDTSLNIIGFVENPEVSLNHVAASAENNIIPGAALPAQALILASDLNSGNTSWRFEFNLAKLINENPAVTDFSLSINGRGTTAGQLSGAFSLRSNDAVMTMNNLGGSLMPSVTGGTNIGSFTNFSRPLSSGANGSYQESDLPVIIRFNYNVPSKTLSYDASVVIAYNLQRNPPPPNVDANFSLQKNGLTTDLVTFTGAGTSTGNYQLGDTLTVNLFHYLGIRWPEDASMFLNIKDAAGTVLYNYQGGSLDVADVHSHSFTVNQNYYLIEVSSSSADTSLSTPGYILTNSRNDINDNEVLISIIDGTTNLVMLSGLPMPPFGEERRGAYNVKNDNGSQQVQLENNSSLQVSITLSSDNGFTETFDLGSANGIVKTVPDKSGITIVMN